MMLRAANSPAEVRLVRLMTVASKADMPILRQAMPSVKDTAR